MANQSVIDVKPNNQTISNIRPNQSIFDTKPNNQVVSSPTTVYFDAFSIPTAQLIPLAGFTYPNAQSGVGPRR